MTADISFRPAEREDVPAIAAMAGEFHAYLEAIEVSGRSFAVEDVRARLERWGFGARPLYAAVIAEADGRPVGYAIYNLGFWADRFEGMLLITDLFVREAWRGKGIGRRLMQHLAGIAKAEGCERVMWTVWDKNEAAQRFYRDIGAAHMAEEQLFAWRVA